MMKTIKFVGALFSNGRPGKFPQLEELYSKLFPGETFPVHDALEDIRALRRCVPELVNLGIIELAQKEYPAEQLKAQFEPEKPKGGRNIEFHDPNPVAEPTDLEEKQDEAKAQVRAWMRSYHKNRWENQPIYPEILIEKKALEGVFAKPCRNWGL